MDDKVDKEDFQQYLLEARTWETDKVKVLISSKRTAWVIASASGLLAFLSVLAVMYTFTPPTPATATARGAILGGGG